MVRRVAVYHGAGAAGAPCSPPACSPPSAPASLAPASPAVRPAVENTGIRSPANRESSAKSLAVSGVSRRRYVQHGEATALLARLLVGRRAPGELHDVGGAVEQEGEPAHRVHQLHHTHPAHGPRQRLGDAPHLCDGAAQPAAEWLLGPRGGAALSRGRLGDRVARRTDACKHADNAHHGKLAELAAAEPAERRPGGQVHPAAPVPNNVAHVQHAPVPRVCRVLLRGARVVQHERATDHLQPIHGKVKHPEPRDAQHERQLRNPRVAHGVPVAEPGADRVREQRGQRVREGDHARRRREHQGRPQHVLSAAEARRRRVREGAEHRLHHQARKRARDPHIARRLLAKPDREQVRRPVAAEPVSTTPSHRPPHTQARGSRPPGTPQDSV